MLSSQERRQIAEIKLQPLFVRNHELYCAWLIRTDRDGLLPSFGLGENRALDAVFGQDVIRLLFAEQVPSFMPGDDLVGTRRDVGEFEASGLVGDGIV